MKKLIAILLAAVMIISVFPLAASASHFEDVADGKWYSEGIEFCYMNGYMAGVSDTEFDRNGTLTRAMFVTILASLENVDTERYKFASYFTDVTVGKWYSGAIAWAYKNGLASGLGDDTFGYKNPVTREQIAVFMMAYGKYSNTTYPDLPLMDIQSRADLSGYTDAGRIHDWAKEGVQWAVACGLISGTTESTLDPRGNCTRAQAAVIIQTLMTEIDKRCDHNWIEASCTDFGHCDNCWLISGSPKDHNYNDEGICTICGAVYDPETGCGHIWIEADCEYDGYCAICGAAGEPATGHNFVVDEDDSFFKVCTKCGYYICAGEHIWIEATCTIDGYCAICGEFYETAPGHKLDEYGECVNCGGSYDEEAGCFHEWVEPSCEYDGYCVVCGMTGELSDGHEFENGECIVCGAIECVHVWKDATCSMPRYCTLCYEVDTDSPATGHDFLSSGSYICTKCKVYHNPNFTAHQNVMYNIQTRGRSLADGSRAFVLNSSNDSGDITTTLFMRPGNESSVFFSCTYIENISGAKLSYEIELKEDTNEYSFSLEQENADSRFAVSGIIDAAAYSENGDINIVDCYIEGDYDQDTVEAASSLSILVFFMINESILVENTNVSLTDYGFTIFADSVTTM